MEESKVPLLQDVGQEEQEQGSLAKRVWVESKELWHIVGPSIIGRTASYSMQVITQAFAGHLGELELAAMSLTWSVIIGLDYGLMLGMSSALETICGQAYGAKNYRMLGIYVQRSWIIMTISCVLILPLYLFSTPMLKMMGQSHDVAEMSGRLTQWMIPMHFCYALLFPLQRFLQSQRKAAVIAWINLVALVVHVLITWFFVAELKVGLIGTVVALNFSWWFTALAMFAYTVCGGCPHIWSRFSMEAFSGLWEFAKLSISSGVMICLETWYYRMLVLMTGNLSNPEIALDALSICMSINTWEMMIPMAFLAATGVRVANELGAGNGKRAKFATVVAVMTSIVIGLFFLILVMVLHGELAFIFSTSKAVAVAVNKLSVLLGFTILLNSVQPVLSGVAVGSGWQSSVAYINLACYYLVEVPFGFLLGLKFNFGIMGIWGGMIFGGTFVQTLVLMFITFRCGWDNEAEKASARVKKCRRGT